MRASALLAILALTGCDEVVDDGSSSSDVDALRERILALEEDREADRAVIADLGARVAASESQQARMDAEQDAVDAHLGAVESAVSDLEEARGTLAGRLVDLEALAGTVDSRVGTVEARNDSLDVEVAAVQQSVAAMASTQEDVALAVTDLDGTVSGLLGSVATTSRRLDGLAADMGELTGSLEQLADRATGSGVAFDDVILFTGPAPEPAWSPLDLSSWVGARPALVVLEVDIPGDAGSGEYFFRDFGAPQGELNSNAIGATQGYIENAGTNYVVVATDDLGRLEWRTQFSPDTPLALRLVAHVN